MSVKNIAEGFGNLIIGKDVPGSEGRYAKCLVCPEFKKLTKRCGKCGCYLPAKVKVPSEKCPLGKW